MNDNHIADEREKGSALPGEHVAWQWRNKVFGTWHFANDIHHAEFMRQNGHETRALCVAAPITYDKSVVKRIATQMGWAPKDADADTAGAKPGEYREGTEHSQVLADLSAGEFKPMFSELQDVVINGRMIRADEVLDIARMTMGGVADNEKGILMFVHALFAATPASSVADAAGAKTDAEALYDAWQTAIAYMDEQKSAAGASERADVEKDAALDRLVAEQERLGLYDEMLTDGTTTKLWFECGENYMQFARAILAANGEKK